MSGFITSSAAGKLDSGHPYGLGNANCVTFMVLTRLEKLLESPSGKRLRNVIRHAREMDDLATVLRSSLPDEAAPHLIAANLREQKELVLICSSSSWAARIRFERDAIIAAARAAGVEVDRCSVKVARR